ncbi:MAG TPA: hypothetical protein VE863_02100 [Pyrinomonadaceae bacterium]|nr:hypothetical protein [Pyrinomonadaceae bacterium]
MTPSVRRVDQLIGLFDDLRVRMIAFFYFSFSNLSSQHFSLQLLPAAPGEHGNSDHAQYRDRCQVVYTGGVVCGDPVRETIQRLCNHAHNKKNHCKQKDYNRIR